jgi:hypothetical protein
VTTFIHWPGRAHIISSFALYLTSNFAMLTRDIGVLAGTSIAALPTIGFLNLRSANDQTIMTVIRPDPEE